jgi:hypothetical protein
VNDERETVDAQPNGQSPTYAFNTAVTVPSEISIFLLLLFDRDTYQVVDVAIPAKSHCVPHPSKSQYHSFCTHVAMHLTSLTFHFSQYYVKYKSSRRTRTADELKDGFELGFLRLRACGRTE